LSDRSMNLMVLCMTLSGCWKLSLIHHGSLYVIIQTSLVLNSSILAAG